jgi:hypothetical protein
MIFIACLGSIVNGALQIVLIVFGNIVDSFTEFSRNCVQSNSTLIDYFDNVSNASINMSTSGLAKDTLSDKMKIQAICLIRKLIDFRFFLIEQYIFYLSGCLFSNWHWYNDFQLFSNNLLDDFVDQTNQRNSKAIIHLNSETRHSMV